MIAVIDWILLLRLNDTRRRRRSKTMMMAHHNMFLLALLVLCSTSAANATCTGSIIGRPWSCPSYNKYCCPAVLDYGEPGYCTGRENSACQDTGCNDVPGCRCGGDYDRTCYSTIIGSHVSAWTVVCEGSPEDCEDYSNSESQCVASPGCTWTEPRPTPYPTARPSDAPCTCANGDNGGACGVCLKAIDSSQCPTSFTGIRVCSELTEPGALCFDGSLCSTENINNCEGVYDIYQRISCDEEEEFIVATPFPTHRPTPAPTSAPAHITPPPPIWTPAPVAPPCSCSKGDNGGECGICLRAVDADECPPNPGLLKWCSISGLEASEGGVCGSKTNECGTNKDLGNCDNI